MAIGEFPKRMIHPAYAKSVVTPMPYTDSLGRERMDYHGTPDRFPPVDVTDADGEEQYRAKGYLPYGEQPMTAVGYQEYPKMMSHPDHVPEVPAIVAVTNLNGQLVSPAIPGRPAKFPPLQVNDAAEEKSAAAKGYILPGKPDPAAVEAAKASPYDPNRVTREYPKLVNGVMIQDPNVDHTGFQEYPKWVGDVLVNTRAEEIALVGEKPEDKAAKALEKSERAKSLKAEAEALAAEAEAELDEATAPDALDERTQLYADAELQGVKIDKRWSVDRIKQALQQNAA